MAATAKAIAYNELWEALDKLAKTRVCGACGGWLTLAVRDGMPALRCHGTCNTYIESDHTRRPKGQYREAIERVYGQEGKPMTTQALTTMTEAQMLTRIGMAKFPTELTPVDKRVLAQAAISYGFDPLMNEISIYQGRPYVSIDGRYRKAQETGRLAGVDTRPASKEERAAWQIPDGDFFYRSEVYVKDVGRPFVGWGRVFLAETVGGKGFKPIEKNAQRMAEKRAEAQALRKAFSIPLPSMEDIGMDDEGAGLPATPTGQQQPSEPISDELEESFPREGQPGVTPAQWETFRKLCRDRRVDDDRLRKYLGLVAGASLDVPPPTMDGTGYAALMRMANAKEA